jgi:large subunit ribosomal protein L30
MLKITLSKGLVARREVHRKVVRALGLGKYGSTVVHADSPTIRGMVNKISYLLTVENIDQPATEKAAEKKPAAAKKQAAAKTEG